MSKGAKIALSIVLGFLAALFGMLYLNEQKRELIGSTEMVRVWVASQDIPANATLVPDALALRDVPRLYLQPASITYSDIPDKAKVQGITMVPIREGEQIVRTKAVGGAYASLVGGHEEDEGSSRGGGEYFRSPQRHQWSDHPR